jgi:hypothetical protein
MKKIYALLFTLTFSCISFGQTIFSENMGTPTGTTALTTYITGTAPATFQNVAPIVFSGTADVRISSASTTYVGASGGGNVYLTNSAGKYFQIDGINTSNYTSAYLKMTFGYLTATFATVQVILEYSTNATATTPTWTPITFTNNPSASWALVSIPGGVLPASSSLSLRFTQPTTAGQIRIDDITVFNYNPACTLVLGAPTSLCNAITSGIDTYTATIPYTGGGTGTYLITPSSGTVGGDNPNSVAAGNINVSGITEGTNLTVNIVNGACSYSSLLSSPECKPINPLPYSESFPYTVGNNIGLEQKWTNLFTGDDVLVSSENLSYTGIASTGNSTSFIGAGKDPFTPFTTTTTGTVYASFLFNVTSMSNVTVDATETYFASLTDNLKGYLARIFLKKSGTQYLIGFDSASTTTNYDTTLRNVGDVIYVVLSYDFATNSLKAWLNPTIATFNATNPTLINTPIVIAPATSFINIGGFVLRQDSDTKTPAITFDELKVGVSLTDIGLTLASTQNEIAGLKVYPNPVSNGVLHVESNLNTERTISLFDVLGKQVLSTTTSNNTINIAALNSGVYILKITEGGKTATRKLVIN